MYEQEVQGRLPQSSSESSEISLRTQALYLSALPLPLVNFPFSILLSHDCNFAATTLYIIFHNFEWNKEDMQPNHSPVSVPFIWKAISTHSHPRGPLEDFHYHIDQNWTTQLALTIMKVRKRNICLSILYTGKKNRVGSSFWNLTIIILKFKLMTHVYIIYKLLVILVNYSWVQDLQEPWFRISSLFWQKKKKVENADEGNNNKGAAMRATAMSDADNVEL